MQAELLERMCMQNCKNQNPACNKSNLNFVLYKILCKQCMSTEIYREESARCCTRFYASRTALSPSVFSLAHYWIQAIISFDKDGIKNG